MPPCSTAQGSASRAGVVPFSSASPSTLSASASSQPSRVPLSTLCEPRDGELAQPQNTSPETAMSDVAIEQPPLRAGLQDPTPRPAAGAAGLASRAAGHWQSLPESSSATELLGAEMFRRCRWRREPRCWSPRSRSSTIGRFRSRRRSSGQGCRCRRAGSGAARAGALVRQGGAASRAVLRDARQEKRSQFAANLSMADADPRPAGVLDSVEQPTVGLGIGSREEVVAPQPAHRSTLWVIALLVHDSEVG